MQQAVQQYRTFGQRRGPMAASTAAAVTTTPGERPSAASRFAFPVLALALLASTPGALAQEQAAEGEPSQDWTPINLAITDAHVLPRYAAFAEAGAELPELASAFCAAPDEAGLAALREGFHDAMDGWQGISHVQFGPITYFNWNYRVHFWPDDNNSGGRQLSAVLAAQDPAVLAPEVFARQSVGVQGFPALERLLFEDDALATLQAEPYRCDLLEAIAANIDEIATGAHQRWTDEFRTTVANADDRGFFESAEDATIDFLKALVETFPRLRDQKLAPALGESQAQARERRAESWRSERSLRNLRLNVAALHDLFGAADADGRQLREVFHAADAEQVDAAFAKLNESLEGLPDSLVAALADADLYAAVTDAKNQVDATYEALERALKNTDLYLGFNSLDGD